MRGMMAAGLCAAAMMLGACQKSEDKADNQAAIANYIPPSVMSRLDFGSAVERRFQALDRDANGKIEKEELPRQDSRIMSLDANGDGVITADEFSKGSMARFDAWDMNKDGVVTSEERRAWRAQHRDAPEPVVTPTPDASAKP